MERAVGVGEVLEERKAVEEAGLATAGGGAVADHDLDRGRCAEEVLAVGVERREDRGPGERAGARDGADGLALHHLGAGAEEIGDEGPRLVGRAGERGDHGVAARGEVGAELGG